MATKGLLSAPPGFSRISPGVYRNAAGKIWKEGELDPARFEGKSDKAFQKSTKSPFAPKPTKDSFKGQQKGTNALLNQEQGKELATGKIAAAQIPGLGEHFAQGPDYSGVQSLGTAKDYNQWVAQNMDAAKQAFDSANSENFANQTESKKQELANRGISQGDPEYAREMKQISDQQNSARNQATSLAYGNAVQGAQALSGTNIALNAAGMGNVNSQYMQPLGTYSALQQVSDPMAMAALQGAEGYGQAQLGADASKYGAQLAAQAKNAQTAAAYNPNNYMNTGMNYGDYASLNQQNALNTLKAQQPSPGSSILSGGAGLLGQVGSAWAGSPSGSATLSSIFS